MNKIACLILTLALSACGGKDKNSVTQGTDLKFGAQKVTAIGDTSNLAITNDAISGSGLVLFDGSYVEYKSEGSYALDFTLEDGGSVTLISHANSNLTGGWEMEFYRNGSGAGTLMVTLRAGGINKDVSAAFGGFNPALPLKFQVDVHNNEDSAAHSLTWSRLFSEDFSKTAAVLNTEDDNSSPGIGIGVHWGLSLRKSAVTRADRGAAKFED